MTLKHGTGVATGVLDLLDALNDFIAADGQGVTVARNSLPGSITGRPAEQQVSLLFSGPGVYVHFQSNLGGLDTTNVDRLWFEPSTALSAVGTSFDGHSGGYGASATLGKSGLALPASGESFTYHFFHDTAWLHIVLSMDGGWFQHAFVGQLDVIGAHAHGFLTQGMCGDGTASQDFNSSTTGTATTLRNNSAVGFPGQGGKGWGSVLNHAGAWVPTHQSSDIGTSSYVGYAIQQFARSATFQRYSPNPYGIAAPPPHHLANTLVYVPAATLWLEPHVTLAGSENNMAPVGFVPGAFAMSNETIAEAEIITIGTDEYLVFPTRTRRVTHREQYQAIAYKLPAA